MAQYYLIKGKQSGLVLDIKKGSTASGADVIIYTKHGKDNQLWYDDPATGTIRSKQTGYCLDLDNDMLVVRPYGGGHHQKWERVGQFIRSRNNHNRVLDVYGGKKSAGSKVGVFDFHGNENQQWEYEYV